MRLVNRTTRSQALTAAGETFYRQCQADARAAGDGDRARFSDQRDSPEGHIRVYAPAELFCYFVNALTEKFTRALPAVAGGVPVRRRETAPARGQH